jgi:Dihydroorotate dehydrogenase
MMEEDYGEAARHLTGVQFAEMNLKYAARLGSEKAPWFEAQEKKFRLILKEVTLFCRAFQHVPLFIKLTRELPWLVPSKEFAHFLRAIRRERRLGRKIGLIIANTRKLRIPANLVCDSEKEECGVEQSGGILAGEHLYIETYNIIRELNHYYYSELHGIPLVATGGIVNLAAFVEVVHAGAKAVQILTGFESYGLKYYSHLREDLEQLIRASKKRSYMDFVRSTEGAPDRDMGDIRSYALDIPARRPSRLGQQLRDDLPKLINALVNQLQAEITAPHTDDDLEKAVTFADGRLATFREVGLHSLSSPQEHQTRAPAGKVGIISPRSSLTARIFVKVLEQIKRGHYRDELVDKNTAQLEHLTSGEDWDLAILTQPCLKELCDKQMEGPARPVVLGPVLTSGYFLWGSRPLPTVRSKVDFYHFGGREGNFAVNELFSKPDLSSQLPKGLKAAEATPVTPEELISKLDQARPYALFLAKEPLCLAYRVITRGAARWGPLRVPMLSYLLASQAFLERVGADVLYQVYADIKTVKQQAPGIVGTSAFSSALENEVQELWKNYLPVKF